MEENFELRDLVAIIERQRKLITYLFCVSVGIALLVNVFVPPVYEAAATMRVKIARTGSNDQNITVSDEQVKQQISTYAEIVKSRVVVETVIDKEFAGSAVKPSYEELIKAIDAQPVKNTELLRISYQSRLPQEAQRVTSSLVKEFRERLTEIVRFENKQARIFLAENLAEAKKNLDKAEKALVEYKRTKGTVTPTSQTNLFLEKQSALTKQMADNRLALAASQARINSLNQQIAREHPEYYADNPLIQQLKSRLADQETELAGLKKTMTEAHPRVIALEGVVASTRERLQVEIARIVRQETISNNPVYQVLAQNKVQAEADLAQARAQKTVLDQQNAEGKKELAQLPITEQGLARLQLDYALAENSYTMVARRFDEARITEMTLPTNIQLVDDAALPEKPIMPRRLLNLAIAVVLGLFAGFSVAFIADYFYKTIDKVDDLRRLGIPVVGSIPCYNRVAKRGKSVWLSLLESLLPAGRKSKHRRAKHAAA
jgi:polysaccharide chain length determinant protein (PEP-CTERM system associated)